MMCGPAKATAVIAPLNNQRSRRRPKLVLDALSVSTLMVRMLKLAGEKIKPLEVTSGEGTELRLTYNPTAKRIPDGTATRQRRARLSRLYSGS